MNESAPTILIVDDETEILETLRRSLRREGYQILTASSGSEALQIMSSEEIDILISDIDMPGMKGVELLNHVRRDHPAVVRMLLTGAASLESAIDAINTGEVHRYLTKPWNTAELRATLRQTVDRMEELRRRAAADHAAGTKERLLEELEREHPGIRRVHLENGVYVVDQRRIMRLVLERQPETWFEVEVSIDGLPGGSTENL
jgi:two-component system, probable response regulator PhcQ